MILGGAPRFWWSRPGWRARLLMPAAALYGAAAGRRLAHGKRAEVDAPVLCVGNFTVGGGGKTPTALALANAARQAGFKPGFLSRGHGGSARQPTLVDRSRHGAETVGDEPLLLAARAPTAVARDREAGAVLLIGEAGCDFIIMDDGFQSAHLAFDHALLVVDASRGLGNGAVVPAGPLRAPMAAQMRHADALLIVGRGESADALIREAAAAGMPMHRSWIVPTNPEDLQGLPLLAFAGIADPGKFYRSLQTIGANVQATRDFPDHHPFSEEQIAELAAQAARGGLTLATTEKDAARLGATRPGARLLKQIRVLKVELQLAPEIGARLIREAADAFAERRAR